MQRETQLKFVDNEHNSTIKTAAETTSPLKHDVVGLAWRPGMSPMLGGRIRYVTLMSNDSHPHAALIW